jgi:hypothetical protein
MWIQMANKDKSGVNVAGQIAKDLDKGVHPARGTADADNQKRTSGLPLAIG